MPLPIQSGCDQHLNGLTMGLVLLMESDMSQRPFFPTDTGLLLVDTCINGPSFAHEIVTAAAVVAAIAVFAESARTSR